MLILFSLFESLKKIKKHTNSPPLVQKHPKGNHGEHSITNEGINKEKVKDLFPLHRLETILLEGGGGCSRDASARNPT